MQLRNLKIAIVCDWLTNFGGAEKVILALHQLFPEAPIYTSVYNPEKMPEFRNARIITSYLQKIPLARTKHQLFLPLYPRIFEGFDLSEYDIVISSSHCCAKGIITSPSTLHVCYCHSPMRYVWDGSHKYISGYKLNRLLKKISGYFLHKIRIWDRLSAERVDYFIANSIHVKKRIFKYYKKQSSVILPFVDTAEFTPGRSRQNYYLAVGRLTPYKKFDLIVEVFNKIGLPIKIAGTGVALESLKKIAKPNVELLGHVTNEELRKLYSEAKGLIFPQVEDFGITPLEAMASGCPVIALAEGGALETVVDGVTGIYFTKQTVESLTGAILKFQKMNFDPDLIAQHAAKFDKKIFEAKILNYISDKWHNWINN